jgi:LEA14-like dessication related protein
MIRRPFLLALAALTLAACASVAPLDPPQVTIGGVEALPGEGLELRMLVKLRVQNPNDSPIDYDGVFIKLEVQGRTFATGVSDEIGSVPRFGEAVIGVPVTVSAFRMARQMMGMLDGKPVDKIRYDMSGKLNGAGFSTVRFQSQGEFALPSAAGAASPQ